MLILFDIDGTLIRTNGAGMRALEDAGREVVGPSFSASGIDFAGSLDPVIIARMLERAGAEASAGMVAAVRARYPSHLSRHLAQRPVGSMGSKGQGVVGALPGVHALLERLRRERDAWTLGLLTGNFEEGARLKLAHCGIDHDAFAVRVYGDDSPHHPPVRSHLTPVAMRRHATRCGWELGRTIDPRRVLVIGDTTHDIGCATAHGARSLGVTTGGHTRAELERAGADLVIDTLEDAGPLLKWMDGLSEQGG